MLALPTHSVMLFFVPNPQAPYNVKLMEFFKASNYRYNEKLKLWSFEFSQYNHFISTLHSDVFFDTHQVVELPRFMINGLKVFVTKLIPLSQRPEPDLSTFMMDTLLPFQLEGVKFVIARKGRAMIADEMVNRMMYFVVVYYYHVFTPI